MNTNIATTQSQSARLLRCGVPADTADMIETRLGNLLNRTQDFPVDETKETLVWSLSALLGLLPKEVGIAVGAYPGSDKYTCFTLIDPDIEPIVADTAIDGVVQMIEQLMNNGYKLNEQ